MLMDISVTASKKKAAEKKPAQVPSIVCTAEEPPGSGSKCGAACSDFNIARCQRHVDWNPPTIIGMKTSSIQGGHRSKRKGCGKSVLRYLNEA